MLKITGQRLRLSLFFIQLQAGVAIAYFALAQLAFMLAFGQDHIAPIWMPAGLALAVVLRLGYRVLPGVGLGTLLVALSSEAPLLLAPIMAVANPLAAAAGCWLLRRYGFCPALTRVSDVLGLIVFAGILAMSISAFCGTTALSVFGPITWDNYLTVLWNWWLGDVMGVILIAPVLLTWSEPKSSQNPACGILESMVFGLTFCAGLLLLFYFRWTHYSLESYLHYLVFPPLLWAAMRMGLRCTTAALLLTAVVISSMTVYGVDSSATLPLNTRLLLNDGFLSVLATTVLLVAAAMAERTKTLSALQASEHRLRDFAASASDWFWETDAELRYTWLSDQFDTATGVSQHLVLGKTRQEVYGDSPDAAGWAEHQALLEARQPFRDFVFHSKRGRWIRSSGLPRFDSAGNFLGYRGTATDITVLKRTEEKAGQLEMRFLQAINTLPMALAVFDADDRLQICNDFYRTNIAGVKDLVQEGHTFAEILHGVVDRGVITGTHQQADDWLRYRLGFHRQGKPTWFEFQYSDEGDWLEVREYPLSDGSVIITEFDITERKRTEAALRDSEQKLRLIIEHVPVLLTFVDREERFQFVNSRYAEFIGKPVSEILGRTLREIVGETAYAVLQPHVRKVFAGGRGNIEQSRVDSKGRPLHLHIFYAPYIDAGVVQGYCAIFVDVTERIEMNKALIAAKEQAESANRAKSDFLAKMSHELRTPMNGVLGMTELLQQTELEPQQRDFLTTIQSSGAALLDIINDILDFAKIEAGKLTLEKSEFNLRQMIQDIEQPLQPRARQKNLSLQVLIDPQVPAMIIGDAARLRQVIVNLLSNAITYTLQGHVELRVQCASISAAELNLRVEVKDTGIGIAAELHEHIFNAFAQADDSRRRQFGGTGLGLSICRELVEMMGGQIGLQSQPGWGSTFWFTCPVTAGVKTTAPNTVAVATDKTTAAAARVIQPQLNAQVLLVEDNMINQLVARTMLQKLGCQVSTADDGHAAVSAATTQHFDLIIMDCQMPELDGYGATIEIRRWEQEHDKCRTPIIALTANVLQEDIERCKTVGMDEYMAKPASLAALHKTLLRWLPEDRLQPPPP